MAFPLADWIESHSDCRYNLGSSGMIGSIRHPLPTRSLVRSASVAELRLELAKNLRVDPQRVFLTHGATEGNASVLFFLAHRYRNRSERCRVRYPEYPALVDAARWAGFEPSDSSTSASVAVVTQPRNPEGYLWAPTELERWKDGTEEMVVDETFREFSGRPSIASRNEPRHWITGSFTKFFGADDLRVGFVVAPGEAVETYARFHGIVHDELAPYSVAGALACLHALPRIRRDVNGLMRRNLAALHAAFPEALPPVAPVFFDRPSHSDGNELAQRCLAASVLVCPGSYFGDGSGVRIGLTRRSFPQDLAAYLEVRRLADASRVRRSQVARNSGPVRPRREGIDRARAGPS